MGTGKDANPAKKLEVYHITLEIDLIDDTITVTHDCGNKGLVAGILMDILRYLHTGHMARLHTLDAYRTGRSADDRHQAEAASSAVDVP